MTGSHLRIEVNQRQVTALLTLPEGAPAQTYLIYAPGAGSNVNDPFGAYLSQRLPVEGIALVRFQFPYMEDQKRRPDSPRILEETWSQVIGRVRPDAKRLIVGGRSMGGRIASHLAAGGATVDSVALFAYPLRPPGNKAKIRDQHLPRITTPVLFCSGTRDAFGTPQELEEAAGKIPGSTVRFLEGADHGFAVLKSRGRTREDVWQEATDHLLGWISLIE